MSAATTTPYQGSDNVPLTPPSIHSSASVSSHGSAARRRKSKSPSLSPNNLSLSLSSEVEDGSGGNEHSNNSDLNGEVPQYPEDDERRATMRQMICNYAIGKSKALVFGQLLAFWLAATGAMQAKLHLDCHLSAPTFSTFSFVFPLSIICLGRLIWKEKGPVLFSRQQSTTSLSELDGLSLQEQGHRNNDHEASTNTQSNESSSSGSNRKMSRIRAKPEKRNHLLSRWSQYPPSVEATTTATNEYDQFYVEGNNTVNIGSTNGVANAQTRQLTFAGLFPIHTPLYKYAVIAAVDVYANYTTILAYKYTTITSVAIFDALAIPSAIIVSKCFFGRRYTKIHYLGVFICFVGIAINILADYLEDEKIENERNGEESAQEQMIEESYPHRVAGDILAILGGVLFGISNTLQEVTVKDGELLEYFGCFSFFASIITFFQAMIFEQDEITAFFTQSSGETCSAREGKFLFLLFAIGGIGNYVGIGFFLQISDAAFFNLSLLTGDAWAVVFSLGEGIVPPPSFYVALIITISGVIMYETAPSPVVDYAQEEIVGDVQLTVVHAEREEEDGDTIEQNAHVLT